MHALGKGKGRLWIKLSFQKGKQSGHLRSFEKTEFINRLLFRRGAHVQENKMLSMVPHIWHQRDQSRCLVQQSEVHDQSLIVQWFTERPEINTHSSTHADWENLYFGNAHLKKKKIQSMLIDHKLLIGTNSVQWLLKKLASYQAAIIEKQTMENKCSDYSSLVRSHGKHCFVSLAH